MMPPALRAGLLTTALGSALGLLVLGVGGRLAMHAFARIGGASGGFTPGGSATVVILGTAAGAGAGLVLFAARRLLGRRPALPSLVFWGALVAYTIPKLDWRDPVQIALFLPLVLAFGVLLQALSRRWAQARPPASQSADPRQP